MNYSKLGYYIAKENEIKINNLLTDRYSAFNCEYYEDFENKIQITTSGYNYNFPVIKNRSGKKVTYEISFDCDTEQSVQFNVNINANGVTEETVAYEVQSDMHCTSIGQFSASVSGNVEFCITFGNITGGFTISNIKLLVMGNGIEFLDYDSTIYFNMVKSDDRVICYYIKNNKLYTSTKLPSFTELSIEDMSYTMGTISASYVFSNTLNSQNHQKLCLIYANALGDLYYRDVDGDTEQFLFNNVSKISAATVPSELSEDILCVMIHDGLAKYFTISVVDGDLVVSKPVSIYVKDEKVQTVQAVNTQSQNIFIIVKTHKNNYLFVNGEEIFENYCIDATCFNVSAFLAESNNDEFVYEEL